METIFDIGMYDGSDTAYYLECGYRVVAVEAHSDLVRRTQNRFKAEVASEQLICINAAIASTPDPVELFVSADDLGSTSVFKDRVIHKRHAGSIQVPGVTILDLLELYGVPHYLKIDIEGSDRLCIIPLTPENRPSYLSFEMGDDVVELVEHAEAIGYTRFKIIHQDSFRELANQNCLRDRAVRRLARYLGYADPQKIKRAGRFFRIGHSSGPVPWKSDGRWYSGKEVLSRLAEANAAHALYGWYDIHAM